MTISIITPTYNSAKTIRDTLASISRQTFTDIEHLIIDGASSDGTLEIIKDYAQRQNNLTTRLKQRVLVISEPDHGLYDAMNKGIKQATGEIVGILNSDDFFRDEKVLAAVAACFQNNPDIDACYGDLEFFKTAKPDKIVRVWRSSQYNKKKLAHGWIIPHPAFFLRRSVYEKFGAFRPEFRLAGDYELMLRLLKIHQIKTAYLPLVLARMRVGGSSSRNLKQRLRGWRELRLAWKINNLKCPPFFIARRVLSKIKQYF